MGIPDSPPSGQKGPLPWDRVVLSLHNLFEIYLVENTKRCKKDCLAEYDIIVTPLKKKKANLEKIIDDYPDLEPILRPVIDDLDRKIEEAENEKDKCLGNCRNTSIKYNETLGKLGVSLGIPKK